MRGDVILVEEHHRRVADIIAARIASDVDSAGRCYTITVAGESGSGKSETAQALADALTGRGLACGIYQQDDYFHLPPRSNDARRRQGIDWVGPGEVCLDLLDAHLLAAREGAAEVRKPLVIYDDDRIDEEVMPLRGLDVVIAEGTYTTMLRHVDTRIFIARNRLETMAARRKRAREEIEPFLEDVLEIEHAIISRHRADADIVISRDYDIEP